MTTMQEFVEWVSQLPTTSDLGRDRIHPNEVLDKVIERARRLEEARVEAQQKLERCGTWYERCEA